MSGPAMNIIVPLGGIGSRFQKEGYARPKPFVCVLGKQVLSISNACTYIRLIYLLITDDPLGSRQSQPARGRFTRDCLQPRFYSRTLLG